LAPLAASTKQEDVTFATPSAPDGNGSATSAAGDLMEEDAVMHDIFAAGLFLSFYSQPFNLRSEH
jgi:hypothetical protein